nr:MAG TPA: hypothetical protein [Caudoviricetes sp.]
MRPAQGSSEARAASRHSPVRARPPFRRWRASRFGHSHPALGPLPASPSLPGLRKAAIPRCRPRQGQRT